jgi:phospholipid transport system substrate-binding protein
MRHENSGREVAPYVGAAVGTAKSQPMRFVMSKRIADLLVETLESGGVRTCYGILGDALNRIAHAIDSSRSLVTPASWANNTSTVFRRRLTVCRGLGVIFMLSLLVVPKPVVALGDPQAVVSLVGAEGLATTAPNVSPAQRDAKLHELFGHYFDVDGGAEFALGRYRAVATPEQQQEFFRLYGEYTVRTYGARLNQIGDATFRVTGVRLNDRSAVVASEISRPDGHRVEVIWSLTNCDGNFKITDLTIGGVSMRMTQRDDFAQWIQNNGGRFDTLLTVMRQQISGMR